MTGISILTKPNSHTYLIDSYQIDTLALQPMWSLLGQEFPDEILYEDFKFRPNLMKAETHSLQVIGVIKLYAELNPYTKITYTPLPAEAKAFWTDDKIRKLGLWKPGKNYEHGMDALRVLLSYLSRSDQNWYEQAISRLR